MSPAYGGGHNKRRLHSEKTEEPKEELAGQHLLAAIYYQVLRIQDFPTEILTLNAKKIGKNVDFRWL